MRKRMKSIIAVAITLSIGSSMFVGCSSNKNATEGGKVTLELFSTKSENQITLQKLIDEFQNENPNIVIELNSPAESETVLRTRLTKDDMPDILSIGGSSIYGELARAGALKELSNEDVVQQVQVAYINMINKLVSKDETKVYAIPYATNANGIIYNVDKFNELGLEVPKTWDEFIQNADKIKEGGQVPFYLTLKDAWTAMVPWNALASNLQPEGFLDNRLEEKTTFKDTHEEIADKILKLTNYGHGDNFGKAYNDGNMAFAQGKSVMYIQGNWAIAEIKKANPDIKLGMFPLPATNDTDNNKLISGVDVLFAITTQSKHPEEAKKFIEFMTKKENAEKYIEEQFAFSALKDVYQKDESVKDIMPYFESGKITSFADHYYPAGMQVANLLQEYLSKKDKDVFLNKLDTEWDKVKATTN